MTNTPINIPTDIPPEQKLKVALLVAEKLPKKAPDEKDLAADKERLEGLTWEKLSDMEKTLLDGALQKDTVEEGVQQVYHNMHHKTGWKYNGSESGKGPAYTRGGKTVGMCQGYREAFADVLRSYDALRKKTGKAAIKEGKLDVEQDFIDAYFCTRQGLTLMGGLKGNVYCKVGRDGTLLEDGIDTINRFVFNQHWTLKVNGVFYDPIFESITATGQDNVEWTLAAGTDRYLADDGSRFVRDNARPSPNGEFKFTFIWVTDWQLFTVTVNGMEHLYTREKKDIDEILSGKEASTWSADQKESHGLAEQIVQEYVSDRDTFLKVVTAASHPDSNLLNTEQFEGVKNILDLAEI
jgi:hypothetical protein